MIARTDRTFWVLFGPCIGVVGLLVAATIHFLPSIAVVARGDRVFRTWYIPSESMLPTLEVGDRIMPRRVGGTFARGDIIVFEGPQDTRVSRIAGIAGDTVALRGGVVTVNGRPATYVRLGRGPDTQAGERSRMVRETFPGGAGPHRMLDIGDGPFDTIAPVRVAPGTLFVLGDNRDRAADSRVPVADGGVGLVPVAAVLGIVDRLYWSRVRARIGRPIDEPVSLR